MNALCIFLNPPPGPNQERAGGQKSGELGVMLCKKEKEEGISMQLLTDRKTPINAKRYAPRTQKLM